MRGWIEHPSGYHGHYDKEIKQLVNRDIIEKLATDETNPIFNKYFEATKRLEETLISSKDFVSHSDDSEKRALIDEVYSRSSHHGEDFKRCDLMFTPVVNSIMMTCATEESGKRIKSMKLKSDPPQETETIPFTELESEIKRLQHKRLEVRHADKKHHRTNAIPSKATMELRQLLEKADNAPPDTPRTAILMTPIKSSRPSSGSVSKGENQRHNIPSPSSVNSTGNQPRPRRPQTAQPSRYLASTRKVQFTNKEEDGKNSTLSPRKKKIINRDESRGIDNSLLQLSDDSSGDENDVFDTFNLKGVYRMKKRGALMGASSDKPAKPPQHLRRAATISRQTSIAQTTQYTIPASINLSEKEAYSAMIATQFLANFLKKKSQTSSLPADPNHLADPGLETTGNPSEEIQSELLQHLFSSQPSVNDPKKSSPRQQEVQYKTIKSKLLNKTIRIPAPTAPTISRQSEIDHTAKVIEESRVTPPPGSIREEKPSEWLEKRMKLLLADYQAGEKKNDQTIPVDEETRKRVETRTISIEISLLFRGFQTIDKTSDGFLSGFDIYSFCNRGSSRHDHTEDSTRLLTKTEIENVMWLMDDNRRGSLTFDDIIKFYLRKRKEFLDSSQDYKVRMPVAPEEMVRMRLHQEHDVVAECDLHSQPLLLFRILFFVAMQDSRGEVHLLTAFQNLSQLFGRAAEDQFNCIFLRNCLDIRDEDRQTLSEFITYLKSFRVRIQRKKLVMREFSDKKAALVHFSYNKDRGSLIDERRHARPDIGDALTELRTQHLLKERNHDN